MIKRSKVIIALVLIMCSFLAVTAFADTDEINTTINIAEANQNLRGIGYFWDNRKSELTLDGVHIDTDDMYGLKLPKDCTVILKGDNYISAKDYGIACSGNVIFKGKGTLTIEAGKIGLFLTSQDNSQKIRLLDGKYIIKSKEYGVYSDAADFSLVSGTMEISADYRAIDGKRVNLLGGKLTANASVYASRALNINAVGLNITAGSVALQGNNIVIENVRFDGFDTYTDQTTVVAKAVKAPGKGSLVFGDTVGIWVDYVLIVLLIAAIAFGIVGPVLRQRKKDKAVRAQLK